MRIRYLLIGFSVPSMIGIVGTVLLTLFIDTGNKAVINPSFQLAWGVLWYIVLASSIPTLFFIFREINKTSLNIGVIILVSLLISCLAIYASMFGMLIAYAQSGGPL